MCLCLTEVDTSGSHLRQGGNEHLSLARGYKGVMSTCRWHGDALMVGRSLRGNGKEGYCVAGPQAVRNCAEVELT